MIQYEINQKVEVVLDGEVRWVGKVVGTYTELRYGVESGKDYYSVGYLVKPLNFLGGFYLWHSAGDVTNKVNESGNKIGFTSLVPCHSDSLRAAREEDND
jgi:hypothetical protein